MSDTQQPTQTLNTLHNIINDLIKDGYSHVKIKQEIFKIVQEISKALPEQQVLINTTHGGFGYSDEFDEYLSNTDINQQLLSPELRMKHVDDINTFGAVCKHKYPLIAELIAIYKKYNLRKISYILSSIEYVNVHLEKATKFISNMHNLPVTEFGTETDTTKIFMYVDDISKLTKKYEKQALLDFAHNNITSLTREKESREKTLIQSTLENYPHLITLFLERWKEDSKQDPTTLSYTHKDFLKEFNKKTPPSPNVWTCQHHYKADVMLFLMKHHRHFPITFQDVHNTVTDAEIGLLAASGPYCKLEIVAVPQGLHWYIHDYDGKESICVVP